MRTLRFIVDGQSIRPDLSCDFSGIVPGTQGYLHAHFTFNKDWDGCRKAAVFTRFGKEHAAPLAEDMCEIPKEALTSAHFSVSVVGQRENYRITTSKTEVRQNG